MGKNAQAVKKAREGQKEAARERSYRLDLDRNPEIMSDLGINSPTWELGDGRAALYEYTEATDLQPIKSEDNSAEVERKTWKLAYELIAEQYQLMYQIRAILTTHIEWRPSADPLLSAKVNDQVELKLLKLAANSTRLLVRNWDKQLPQGRIVIDRPVGVVRFMGCEFCRDRLDKVSHDHPDLFVYDGPAPKKDDEFIIVYSYIFGFNKTKAVEDARTIAGKMTAIVKCLVMQTFVDLDREFERRKNREGVGAFDVVDILMANDQDRKPGEEPISMVREMDRIEIDKSDPDRWRIIERLRPKQTQGIGGSVGQGTTRDAMPAEHIALGNIMREELGGKLIQRKVLDTETSEGFEEVAEIQGWATHPDRAVRDTVRWLLWLASEDSLLEFTGEGYSRLKPLELSHEWSRMHNEATGDHAYQCLYHCNNPIDPKHATGEEHDCVMVRGGSELDMFEVNGIPLSFDRGVTEIQIGREFKVSKNLIKVAMGLIHDGRKDYLGHVRLPSGKWTDHTMDEPKWSMTPPTLMQMTGEHKLRPGTGGSLYDSAMFTLRGYKYGNEIVNEVALALIAEQNKLHFESLKGAAHKVWNRHDIWSNVADERKYERAWLAAQGYLVPIWSIRPRLGLQFETVESVLWLDGRPVKWSEIDEVWNREFTPIDLRSGNEDDWNPMSESEMKARLKKGQDPDHQEILAALQARVVRGEITADVAEMVKLIIQ
jgi:hypothetical protein